MWGHSKYEGVIRKKCYPKIFVTLNIKKDKSLTPLKTVLNAFNNNLTEKIIDLYEKRFANLEEEIKFLKEFIINKK